MRKSLARFVALPQFAALRFRDSRLLWTASVLSATARWADMVVLGWLTLELTDSAFWVGIVAGSKMAGYIAAPFMGVIADRIDYMCTTIQSGAESREKKMANMKNGERTVKAYRSQSFTGISNGASSPSLPTA